MYGFIERNIILLILSAAQRTSISLKSCVWTRIQLHHDVWVHYPVYLQLRFHVLI